MTHAASHLTKFIQLTRCEPYDRIDLLRIMVTLSNLIIPHKGTAGFSFPLVPSPTHNLTSLTSLIYGIEANLHVEGVTHKVTETKEPNLDIYLKWTPMFESYVVMEGSNNKYREDTWLKEIELHVQNVISFSTQ